MGDSKQTIDWANQKVEVIIMGMESLLCDIHEATNSFELIFFCRILPELNIEVDSLPKEVVELPIGFVNYHVSFDGEQVESMRTNLAS